MDPVHGAQTFQASGQAYDAFMGRYSRPLATLFADFAGVGEGMSVLDLGCGPGALTGELVERLGAESVSACDPSSPFVQECAARHPGVEVRQGSAEAIPFEDGSFDAVLAELVLHFVSEPSPAVRECRRVLHPGGTMAACVWDFAEGMHMLRHFWDAALSLDPDAPDEARTLRFGRQGEIADLLEVSGFRDVTETTLTVSSTYTDYDELWSGFLAGIGPAGAYCTGLSSQARDALREELFRSVGAPAGAFSLAAVARCASGLAEGDH